MKETLNSKLYILVVIGIVSAFGPFVTDFYLPALPVLAGYFDTTASLIQLSLTFSMVGLAVGQLVIGPLSDKYGRKKTLMASLVLFCISTIGCLYASDIYVFIFFRLLQGLSGAGGVVISKSIATDLYEGRELTRFFSMLRILVLIGILLIMALAFFKESLNNEQQHCGVFATFRNYIPVFQNAQFMRYVLVQAFAMGVMFTYIAASPFIFQEHFNMSPLAYSLCFGANAIAIMLGSLTVSLFHDATDALRVGSIGFGIMSLFVAAALFFSTSVWPVEVSLFVFMLFLGVILPSSTTLALDLERKNSGNASALLGFLMFLFGGVLSPLTGLGNMLYTTGIIIVACCIGTWFCNHIATSHIALKVTKQ